MTVTNRIFGVRELGPVCAIGNTCIYLQDR